MSRITFVTWDGAGNLPPTVAVAAELVARGHDVDMIGHRAVARSAAAAGAEFTGYPTARPWSSAEPSGPLAMVSMLGDPALGRDVVAHVRQRGSDLVIVDCVLFGAMHALRSEGIAYVAFEHLCDGYLRGAARGPLGLGLRVKGLRPLELLDGAVSRLTMTIPELDRGHGDVTHVGPAVTAAPSRAGGPAVLASLSTYAYPGMRRVWQRVLDGLDGLDARVVATTGPCVDPASLRIPANVEVHRWLDHGEVLPEMTAVIGPGGHGTAVAARAHGLPLLALPGLASHSAMASTHGPPPSAGAGVPLSFGMDLYSNFSMRPPTEPSKEGDLPPVSVLSRTEPSFTSSRMNVSSSPMARNSRVCRAV